jgi:hypothetical protein
MLDLMASVGDTLVEGTRVVELHGAGVRLDGATLLSHIRVGAERTFEQDPKYPMRLLVAIAIKASSPALNDPTTAVHALNQIEDLLRRLSWLELGSVWLADDTGRARLFAPLPDWDEYLSLAFDEIRQLGLTSVQVMRRMRAARRPGGDNRPGGPAPAGADLSLAPRQRDPLVEPRPHGPRRRAWPNCRASDCAASSKANRPPRTARTLSWARARPSLGLGRKVPPEGSRHARRVP